MPVLDVTAHETQHLHVQVASPGKEQELWGYLTVIQPEKHSEKSPLFILTCL